MALTLAMTAVLEKHDFNKLVYWDTLTAPLTYIDL